MGPGITLLAEVENYKNVWGWNPIGTLFILMGIAILCLYVYRTWNNKEVDRWEEYFMALVICISICFGVFINMDAKKEFDHFTYKVYIDDNAPFVQVWDRFEIVGQEGLIYELRDRYEQDYN